MATIKNIIHGNLKNKLVELIRLKGAMTVADYMKIVLTNPEKGFYMNNDVFGVKGHFTTNPEISQIFGEILGVWILQEWRRINCPKPLRLVEFGPGRGTLMLDITRTLKKFNETDDNIHLRMIEASPHLKTIQYQNLAKQSGSLAKNTTWHVDIDNLDEESDGYTAYIAHEFLDALPIHKFVYDTEVKNWRELLIDYDHNNNLRFCKSRQALTSQLLIPRDFVSDHVEVCPQAALTLEKVSNRLNKTGKGCMLVCDYGFEDEPDSKNSDNSSRVTFLKPMRSNRDTFRAFKEHKLWPPLQDPGEADLTADVDFGYLKRHIKDKATIFGSVSQKEFLVKCGLQARLEVLLNKGCSNDKEREELISGASMMVNDMGDRYRFLALFPKQLGPLFNEDPPAGFDDLVGQRSFRSTGSH